MISLSEIFILYLALISGTQISNVSAAGNTNKIIGGKLLKNRKLSRYVVSVRFGNYIHYYKSRCGGSILTTRAVLTAGHCAVNSQFQLGKHIYVIAGSLKSDNLADEAQVHPVSKVILHPDYTELHALADLAVLKTFTRIYEDGKYVLRAPLTHREPSMETNCIAMGYGNEYGTGDLMFVEHKIILDGADCPLATENLFCAGDVTDEMKTAEFGDSGSPLICDGVVAGIVSRDQGPKNFKYYVNVHYYEKWIRTTAGLSCSANLKFSFNILIFSVVSGHFCSRL